VLPVVAPGTTETDVPTMVKLGVCWALMTRVPLVVEVWLFASDTVSVMVSVYGAKDVVQVEPVQTWMPLLFQT
jgi:hypothetical protein